MTSGMASLRKMPAGEQLPFISVVMPVRNEAGYIERTLGQLLAQRYDPSHFEILVVDGQSTDETCDKVRALAKKHAHLRLLSNPKRLSSAARNIGVKAARGELILIVDGHCELESNQLLRNVAATFEQSGADCLGRPQPLDVSDATRQQKAIAAARSSRLGHHPDSFIYSGDAQFVPAHSVAVAYRKSVFDQIGYFDEEFDACEDVEFNTRIDQAGLRCFLTPEITVRYHPRHSLWGLFRQLVRYGRGRVRLFRKHRDTLTIRTLLPAFFVAGCVIGAVAMWFSQTIAAIYLSTLAVYLFLVITASISIAIRERDPLSLFLLPLVFVTIHVSAGVGILLELVSPSSRTRKPVVQ